METWEPGTQATLCLKGENFICHCGGTDFTLGEEVNTFTCNLCGCTYDGHNDEN